MAVQRLGFAKLDVQKDLLQTLVCELNMVSWGVALMRFLGGNLPAVRLLVVNKTLLLTLEYSTSGENQYTK